LKNRCRERERGLEENLLRKKTEVGMTTVARGREETREGERREGKEERGDVKERRESGEGEGSESISEEKRERRGERRESGEGEGSESVSE